EPPGSRNIGSAPGLEELAYAAKCCGSETQLRYFETAEMLVFHGGYLEAAAGAMRATPAMIRSVNCPNARLMVAASVVGHEPLEGTWISSVAACAPACFNFHTARSVTLQLASP